MKRMKKTGTTGGAIILMSLFTTAHGQTTAPEKQDESQLPGIIVQERAQERGYQPKRATTATRSDAALIDTPQAVAVVPAQVLQDQDVRNIDEALYNVSGITQANTLGGTQDALIKRGFGFNRDGSILRDGVRTVLARNLTFTTERVEVLKGPASIMYGTMDPGGVINMVTKKPQLNFQGQVIGTKSNFGGGGSLDLTGPIGDSGLAYRLIADYSNDDYWRSFGSDKQTVIAPSLAWYGRDSTVRISYEHTDYEQPFDRGTVIDLRTKKPVAIPSDRRIDEPYNRTLGNSDFFTIQGQHRFNEQWKTDLTYSYNRNRYDDYQARPVSLNPVTGILTRRPDGTRGAVSQQHVWQAVLSGNLDFGSTRHEVQFGADAEDSNIYRRDLIRGNPNATFNVYNPVYGLLPFSTAVSAPDSDQTDKLRSYSVFTQDTIHLDEHWIVQAGLRYQTYTEMAGKGRPFIVGSDVEGSKLVPRAGVVYKINDSVALYGSYAQSFKPNTSIATVITALPPEEGKSFEVGAKFDMQKGVTATIALYNINKTNVQVQDPPINGITQIRAAGKARSRGIEVDVSGDITRQLKVIGAYAYTDAVVVEDTRYQGNALANVARQSGSVFLTYDFDRMENGGRWCSGAGVRHVGSRAGDSANTFTLDPYQVVDAFASYDTKLDGKLLRLQLNVKNLLNKTYYSSSGSNIYVSLGDPREVILRAVLDF